MRREYENKGGGLPEGCVLWLPFTSATDLKDRVTGNDVVIDHPDCFFWDDTQQAFYMDTQDTYQGPYLAHLSYPNFRSQFIDDNYSVIMDVAMANYVPSSSSTFCSPYAGQGTGAVASLRTIWSIGAISGLPSKKVKFRLIQLCDASYRTTYANEKQLRQSGTSRQYFPPSKWPALVNPEITFNTYDGKFKCYLSGVMIFNRKLTIEEAMNIDIKGNE